MLQVCRKITSISPNIDRIEKNEMGEVCSTYGGRKSCIHGFGEEA